MSTITGLISAGGGGGGAGLPVNTIAKINSNDKLHTDESGGVWLRTGNIIAVDSSTYPDATVGGWDVRNMVNNNETYTFTSEDTFPVSVRFNNDGTKLFMLGQTGRTVDQYSLTTAYDLSTMSYDSVSFSVSTQDSLPEGLEFNDDGTIMYMIGSTNDNIYQYTLTTAFDISTASYASKSFSCNPETTPSDLIFSNDGTQMFFVGSSGDSIRQHILSTPYDISTAVFQKFMSVASEENTPYAIQFNPNGSRLYVLGHQQDQIVYYDLTIPFDIGSATFVTQVAFPVSIGNPESLVFSGDGDKVFVLRSPGDQLRAFDLTQYMGVLPSISNNPYEYVKLK